MITGNYNLEVEDDECLEIRKAPGTASARLFGNGDMALLNITREAGDLP